MRGKILSIGLRATLAIISLILFAIVTASGQERVLHTFGHDGDGSYPYAGLIGDAAGNLYGTTSGGGIHNNGAVFELTPGQGGGWTERVLHSFGNGTDGTQPDAGLIFDAAGNLYGTTSGGGIHTYGTVFELMPREGGGWTETVLHSFGNGEDGRTPYAGLIFDTVGNLYGSTYYGGIHGAGTVFELTSTGGGDWSEKVLYSFGRGTDGQWPYASLIWDAAGNLYGTTGGGIHGYGTVFELTPTGGGNWSEKLVQSLGRGTHGHYPQASLIRDAAGNLYGTTDSGGIHDLGTVFELTPNNDGGWTELVLHHFGLGSDGSRPDGGLIWDAAGNLYGTTSTGGVNNDGTVFELTPNGNGGWTENRLYDFDYGSGADGALPHVGLLWDAAGNLYGTTSGDSAHGPGTVFEIMAGEIFTENFSGAVPGTYGPGNIAGTQVSVTGGNVDIIGVLNGWYYVCDNNPLGNCLDLIGYLGHGSIRSTHTFNLVAGNTYTITFGVIVQGADADLQFSVGLGHFSQIETATPVAQEMVLTYTPDVNQSDASLTFASITNVDGVHGPVLDHISVTESIGVRHGARKPGIFGFFTRFRRP